MEKFAQPGPHLFPEDMYTDQPEKQLCAEMCIRDSYELGTAEEYAFTQLGRGVSMGVHESQSRFFENIIGRSRAFCSLAWPELVRLCPELGRYTVVYYDHFLRTSTEH